MPRRPAILSRQRSHEAARYASRIRSRRAPRSDGRAARCCRTGRGEGCGGAALGKRSRGPRQQRGAVALRQAARAPRMGRRVEHLLGASARHRLGGTGATAVRAASLAKTDARRRRAQPCGRGRAADDPQHTRGRADNRSERRGDMPGAAAARGLMPPPTTPPPEMPLQGRRARRAPGRPNGRCVPWPRHGRSRRTRGPSRRWRSFVSAPGWDSGGPVRRDPAGHARSW